MRWLPKGSSNRAGTDDQCSLGSHNDSADPVVVNCQAVSCESILFD